MKMKLLLAAALVAMAPVAQAETLMDVYKHLHADPELSSMETETAAYLAKRMKTLGFDVTENFGGTGVVSVMKNGPGKTIMIRADMDGLPVKENTGLPYASTVVKKDRFGDEWPVMHACGHDIHMTTFLGTAQELVANKDLWSGTLVMILQPAEEISHGAKDMLKAGLFTKFPRPDYNLALHANSGMPAGMVGITSGYALANVDSVDITVKGVGGHGAYPQTTKDPIVLASQIVLALQTIVSREVAAQDSAVVTVGSIHGGTKHNIIGEEVKLQLTVRSYSDETRDMLMASIKRISENMGRVAGLPEDKLPIVEIKDEYTPAAYNNPDLSARAMETMAEVIGAENVVVSAPVMGGEDFGRYGRTEPKIPGMIYWLGAADPAEVKAAKKAGKSMPSLHSPFFKPDAAAAIPVGVDTMTATAVSLFNE
ncbi:amidohydrolase [Hellea balneolensis]|uniref:amidohydrolase n=1 Tax=Hellea balneolensis TaxID=287478 RepID=UPI0004151A9E|nr:amidohydrolase [Hellea balneolensis]